MHRTSGQGDLIEAFLPSGLGRNARLERIAALFDWTAPERLLGQIYAARTGRPSYPPPPFQAFPAKGNPSARLSGATFRSEVPDLSC